MTKRKGANLSNLAMLFKVLLDISWVFPCASMEHISILPLFGLALCLSRRVWTVNTARETQCGRKKNAINSLSVYAEYMAGLFLYICR